MSDPFEDDDARRRREDREALKAWARGMWQKHKGKILIGAGVAGALLAWGSVKDKRR
jgi:hypothetical protein